MSILCIGEVLWDVFGQKELLGGAPLNFSITLTRLGHPTALLTAVGDDPLGRRAIEHIKAHGLSAEWIQTITGTRTGTAVVTTDSCGNATYQIKRPAAFDFLKFDDALLRRIEAFAPSWLYFGTLAQSPPGNTSLIDQIRQRVPGIQCFYDVNLRESHWNLALVEQLSTLAAIMQLNEAEARTLHCELHGNTPFRVEDFCRDWARTHRVSTLCVTLGENGCGIFTNDTYARFDGFQVDVADTVGAGDAFAAAFLHGTLVAWPIAKTASFANAMGSVVAAQDGAIADWSPESIDRFLSKASKKGGICLA